MSETGPSVKSGIARIAGAVGLAALGFGLNSAETAHADPTKTPTPTVSPTPDATRTTAESALKDLEERLKREQELKAIRDKAAAVKAALDALTTPTATPTPLPTATPSPTPDATKEALFQEEMAERRRRGTPQAQATAASPTSTPGPGEEGGSDPRGFDPGKFVKENLGKAVALIAVFVLGGVVFTKAKEAVLRVVRRRRNPVEPSVHGL